MNVPERNSKPSENKGIRKVPQTPPLDTAQRRAGYDRSLELRRQRMQLKASVASGDVSLEDAFDTDEAQGMKVRGLLLALPGVGGRTADRLLQAAGIHPARSVSQMGPHQKNALLKALSA